MSGDPVDMRDGTSIGAEELFARAAAAESCAHLGLSVAIDDFFLPEAARLDERTRSALAALLRGIVAAVEGEMRDQGVRLLNSRGQAELAEALAGDRSSVFGRLSSAGLLRDPELMAELLDRVRQDALGAALPMQAPDDPERPSLITRFVQHPDRVLAASAMAVLLAESRRRGSPDTGQLVQSDLPAELHHRLVWWVAAALRERVDGPADALDRALADAAQRSLAAYDEGAGLEAAALRFAAAIDPEPAELTQLLVEALGDRRIVLFVALLGHGIGLPYPLARGAVLDPSGGRLWVALRALDLPREAIAQIGYVLCEADPRRDLEAFADMLDTIMALAPARAREALAPLRLDPDYRAALRTLAERRP